MVVRLRSQSVMNDKGEVIQCRTTMTDVTALVRTLRRLGELYEARGEREKAKEYYSRFVALWRDADSDLQPAVQDVKARLAQLAAEPKP
jgi:hypothetical protein